MISAYRQVLPVTALNFYWESQAWVMGQLHFCTSSGGFKVVTAVTFTDFLRQLSSSEGASTLMSTSQMSTLHWYIAAGLKEEGVFFHGKNVKLMIATSVYD
jgi:hypothetical protein